MAKQNLNIGSSANDGTGDSLRDGAIKLNSVIDELYTNLGNNTNLQINVGTPSTGQLLKWNGAQFAEGNFDAFSSDVDVNGNKIVSTFKSNGYNYNDSITFKSHRHLTPLVKKNKIFPVEIHTRPLNILNFKYLTVKQMITNKLIKKNSFVPSYENQFYLNIYNFLINDFGYHTLSYNYKNIYDTFLINKKMKSKIVGNRFIIFYAKLYSILTKETISNKEIKKSFSLKFYLVSKFKILFYLNLFFFKINNTFRNRTRQIFEILNNKKYRIFLFKKLK